MTKHFISHWKSLKRSELSFEKFTDGITNALFCVSGPSSSSSDGVDGGVILKVLVRIYGHATEKIINRKKELVLFEAMAKNGGVPLYGRFGNGYVYGLEPGRALQPKELKKESIAIHIAKRLVELHKMDAPGPKEVSIYNQILEWVKMVPETYSKESQQAVFSSKVKPFLDGYVSAVESIRSANEALKDNPVGFCHNDLLCGNIIYDESKDAVTFIDMEYAGYQPVAYDIANHFCEFAGFDGDYEAYPNTLESKNWIHTYLTAYDGDMPSNERVEAWVKMVNRYALLSHLYWGTWALIQAANSTIDFDFMDYAVVRYAEFTAKRAAWL